MARPLPPADYPGCPATVTVAEAEGVALRPPRWGLWDVTIGAIGALVIGLAAAAALALADAPTAVAVLLGTTAPWLALLGWPVLATARRGNGPRIDLGWRLTWSDVGWGFVAGCLGLLLAGIAAAITTVFIPDLTSAAAEAAKDLLAGSGGSRPGLSVTLFALAVMVGAPIVEETFFRGLFFGALRKAGVGALWTVLLTGVLFAAFHFEPARFLVLLPTGLILGWVRWRTGSTGSAMVAHGLINAPGAVLLLMGMPGVTP